MAHNVNQQPEATTHPLKADTDSLSDKKHPRQPLSGRNQPPTAPWALATLAGRYAAQLRGLWSRLTWCMHTAYKTSKRD